MTEKELTDMEAAMTKEKIIERAKTLRPVADFQKHNVLTPCVRGL